MMRMKKISLSLAFLVVLLTACSKSSGGGGGNGGGGTPTSTPVVPIITLAPGWKYSATLSINFPSGMQAFSFDTIFNGRKIKAFCVAFDPSSGRFDFKPVVSSTARTTSQFATAETGLVYVAINGGFYGGNQSYSLIKYNGVTSAPNIKAVTRLFNNSNTTYYPTRAAFGLTTSGAPTTAWVYSVGAGNDNIYAYPSPSPNAEGSAPQAVPTENFPAGGSPWNATSAIGGSPMLLRGGAVRISDTEELISINNTTSRPRSAVGYTTSGRVLLLAVEGDNTAAGYPGINLADLASMLGSLGCTDAINLDGGGSTSLVIGNQLTVRPGDNGVERAVQSALLIKQR
ncbi:MAG: phosphodiester glycosidase family protein [Sphingomonadales bacterium]|nr:phosphodiester glycosidase family protein [Sphingomonadales bacterium]